MLIDFPGMEDAILPNFKGGEKALAAKMFFDGTNRIMCARLTPGTSIGLHTHDTSSEIIYILSGVGSVLCDGAEETVRPGQCHYCPKGGAHTLKNNGDGDLVFFAVVPQQ